MTYSGKSQRAFEHASEAQHHAANEASDAKWEAFEAFREKRTDAESLEAMTDFLNACTKATGDVLSKLSYHGGTQMIATVKFDAVAAFELWDFERWAA